MEVILREDVKSLGRAGDLVRVKPGYGRNYLLPGGLASLAGAADEIVVVDTGSRDRTPAIAEAAGCLVYRARWPDVATTRCTWG